MPLIPPTQGQVVSYCVDGSVVRAATVVRVINNNTIDLSWYSNPEIDMQAACLVFVAAVPYGSAQTANSWF